jgi:integrase
VVFTTYPACDSIAPRTIVARETNPERRAFYELAWHIGASQSDIAFLDAENVDWTTKILSYERKKTGELAFIRFGAEVETILRSRPEVGALFPYLRTVRAGDRATEFKHRCRGLGIEGVSLHSYRYAWAERARKSGYPERFAQDALGHNSKAVHRAYARKAKVELHIGILGELAEAFLQEAYRPGNVAGLVCEPAHGTET